MDKGYVKMHRSIMDHSLWADKPFAKGQAWMDLIMLANAVDKSRSARGVTIRYKTGYVYSSIADLANRWGWSRQKTYRFIGYLVENGMIERVFVGKNGEKKPKKSGQQNGQQSGQKTDTFADTFRGAIYIVNYSKFQHFEEDSGHFCGHESGQQSGQQSENKLIMNITNNDLTNNELTNRERVERESLSSPPTLQEIKSYISEKQLRVDPEKFFAYYSESGWKDAAGKTVKNWKLKAISWSNRESKKTEKTADNFEPRQNDYDSIERELSERTY